MFLRDIFSDPVDVQRQREKQQEFWKTEQGDITCDQSDMLLEGGKERWKALYQMPVCF